MDSKDRRGAPPSLGTDALTGRLRALGLGARRSLRRAKAGAKKGVAWALTFIMALNTFVGSIPATALAAPAVSDGWYYLVADGGTAKDSFVLNLDDCSPSVGANAHITNPGGSYDSLTLLENMWYVKAAEGDYFTIRTAHGTALTADVDDHDLVQTASYNASDAAQQWRLDGGKLVSKSGVTVTLSDGKQEGSPISGNPGKTSVTWGFEPISVNSTLTLNTTTPRAGVSVSVKGYDPKAAIGYYDGEGGPAGHRQAGASVSFVLVDADGGTHSLPYATSESEVDDVLTVKATVTSAFGVEIWSATATATVKESATSGAGGDGGTTSGDGSVTVTDGYVQVNDSSIFFDEGKYLNQTENAQDPPFSAEDFEVHGGHMVRLEKSLNLPDHDYSKEFGNIYEHCQIWPSLIGHASDDGVEGWGFVCDEKNDDAEGAWFSVTYREVGTLEDAGDPSSEPGPMVDIKVTYKIKDVADGSHVATYPQHYCYDGRPVIQVTDNFSYGVFQFGIVAMDTTFEFFDHNTGEKLNFDAIYYTNTSQDKGEGVAIDPDRIVSEAGAPGVWLSNGAANLATSPSVSDLTRYDVIPGTLLYNGGHCDAAEGMVSFVGAPHIFGANDTVQSPPEYWDTIGNNTYFWRSTCYLLDMAGASSVTVSKIATGWDGWTESFDIADPERWDNGGMMYSTHNFLPLTNPAPKAPHKTINGGTDVVTGVGVGDTVTYAISQQVHDMSGDGLVKYTSFVYTDPLPEYVEYADGTAVVRDPYGNPLGTGDYSVDYDAGSNILTVALSEDFLQNRMVYAGGEYTLEFDAEVVDQPADDLETVTNTGYVTVNEMQQPTNEVEYEPIKPELSIEKHAVLDYQLATSINEYEYLNHDENAEFSTVHYTSTTRNVTDKTRAKNVVIFDDLPAGLSLVPGSVKVSGATGAQVSYDGADGFSVSIADLACWQDVTIEYDCHTTSEGNGLEVVNTIHTWCTNAKLGTPGAEDRHATNDGEVYINDPNLVVTKSVSESPVQNDDYQRGEEYRVGDEFTYTVTLVNDAPGTIAKSVRLTDDDIPEGFELVGDVQVSGLDDNGKSYKIMYPVSGTSDDVHGEQETRTIEWSLTELDKDGAWGWFLDVNYLDYNRTVTVTWTVRATEPMNGYEVYNRASAVAENQPNDVFWSKDGRTGSDYTVVWVNSPDFDVDKSVRKTDSAYQVGDVATYDIVLKGLKTPGTLARQTTLEDAFATEGTTIIENSFVVTDKPENADDIRGQVELNRHVGDQSWHVDMTQVYGDDCGYWVSSEDWRPIFKDGAEGVVQGEHNPVQVKPEYDDAEGCVSDDVTYGHDYFQVHYEATINDMALQNDLVTNVATADSLEGLPVSDDAQVTVIGAQLMIDKGSTDGGHFSAGDVAEYELTITNNATGTVAENVQIKDGFTTAKAGAVAIVEGSIELLDNQNRPIELADDAITYTRNEAGGIFGFSIDTGYDLPSNQKITVRYDVKYLTNNGSDVVTNVAYTWADNAPEVNDVYETWPDDADQSALHVDKGSDRQAYKGGDVATYTHHVSNKTEDTTAINVVIHDEITADTLGIAQVVKGSVKVWDHEGKAVGLKEITYVYANGGQVKGFEIETGRDLGPGEFFDVEYQVRFDEVAQDAQVHNEVWVAADNTGKATDDLDVVVTPDGGTPVDPDDPDNPDAGAQLAIVKDSNKSYYVPGETGRYTLRVTNPDSGTTAENVVVTDALDADARSHAAIVEGSVVVTDAEGHAIPVQSVSYEKGSDGRAWGFKLMTGYDLASGGAIDVSYDVAFTGDISGKTAVRNAAGASSDNTPSVETDHVVNMDADEHAEIRLDKGADRTEVAPGDELTYTVKVSQPAEGMVARNVVVTDDLPDGFALDQASVRVEKNGHAMTVDVEFPEGKLRAALGDVAYGEDWTVTYTGTVEEDFLGDELHNVVVAESPDIPENPSDETTTPVINPKLAIEKTADKATVEPGDELAWKITVTQVNKAATATDVVVTDELPEGFTARQADVTVTDGQGNDRSANVSLSDGKLTAELGDLGYNDPVTITVNGAVDESFAGDSVVNVAVAEATNVPNPVDDEEEVTVRETPAIDVDKSADSTYVYGGGTVGYTVIATVGEADVKNVVITDELPDELSFVEDSVKVTLNDEAFEAEPSFDGKTMAVEMGDLKAGDVVRVEYDAKVSDDVEDGAALTNVVTVTGDGVDPAEDDATVRTPTPEPGDPGKDMGKDFGNTGDPLAQFAAIALLFALGACGYFVYRFRKGGTDPDDGSDPDSPDVALPRKRS